MYRSTSDQPCHRRSRDEDSLESLIRHRSVASNNFASQPAQPQEQQQQQHHVSAIRTLSTAGSILDRPSDGADEGRNRVKRRKLTVDVIQDVLDMLGDDLNNGLFDDDRGDRATDQ